ncbi:methionyl-tRNA formyltransferase [Agrococcus sp. SGAir0287]|uniref:methionyl-tRNA formyltransferase n=1 Tax=Agrococcus sp. SGAir0287 TaxID=2070347 RepID=UPI0010CD38C1|nr:methionyl-tRNA formyltransferase [Agrococcus sp. SGAir0287]QCR19303.1 methionyl-tRNA formyltransferase [Agrococcus sp. SGAir0287]
MRIVFAGSPAAAVPSLEALARRHEVALVVTRGASPQGRRRVVTPTPVAAAAERLGLTVLEADRLDAAAAEAIAGVGAELGVVVAYGGLVREPLLSTPAHGWINLHFSLLPAYRGAAPVQRALMAGEDETGVSVFRLVPELDAGPIVRMVASPVPPLATAGELLETLAASGADVLVDAVDAIEVGTATFEPQVGEPSFAPKLALADGLLRLDEPAPAVLDRFRGVTPEPGAHVLLGGERVKVLALTRSAADPLPAGTARLVGKDAVLGTATAALALGEVQPAGRQAMRAADWLRGRGGEVVLDA